MRELITLLILLLSTAMLQAQQPHKVYCAISGSQKVTNANGYVGSVSIDYGQEKITKNTLVDEAGKQIYFRSMIAALNYMSARGWELESTDTRYERSLLDDRTMDNIVSIWILSKVVTNDSEITEGYTTRRMYDERVAGE